MGDSAINPRRHIDRVPAVLRSRMMVASSLIVLSLSSWVADGHAQQDQPSRAPGNTIQTLEALPHSPMPPGDFLKWCGSTGKVLMRLDAGTEIYDGAVKASPLTFPTRSTLRCGDDGRKLILGDDEARRLSEVDISGGVVTRTLATYKEELFSPDISFSPDLKSVASDRPLSLAAGVVDLKAILVKRQNVRGIRWNRDSSEFFVISGPPEKAHPGIIEIFNAQFKKIGSGAVRADFLFRDGWFAGPQALYLYFGSIHDEFGSGVILKCRVENWKCDRTATNVLDASVGGDGNPWDSFCRRQVFE